MSRLGPVPLETMSAAERKVFDGITGGARSKGDPAEFLNEHGVLRGPFNAMLRSPELGDLVQQVGAAIRYASVIPGPLRELAILVCAKHWRANYEWYAHAKVAKKEGLPDDVIDRVKLSHVPDDPAQAAVYRFVDDLQTKARIDDDLYAEVLALLGERGVVELTFLAGYYALISHTLNAFDVDIPSGEPLPFPD